MNKIHKELLDIAIKELNDNISDCRKGIEDVNTRLSKLADTIDSCVTLTIGITERLDADAIKKIMEVKDGIKH